MSEQGGLGDLTYKDDHRHQTGPGTVTYHVEVQHGRRRSDAKIPETDDGPLDPAYLHHPVDKTHVQVAVEPHGKTMDEMDQEAHLTAYQMGSATSPHDMVTKTRILHVEAAKSPRYLHATDAVLNVGDVITPAAERGHSSRHSAIPGYSPAHVYMHDTKHDYYDATVHDYHGKHTYGVEPLGPVGKDPEVEHWKQHYKSNPDRAAEAYGSSPEEPWHESDLGSALSSVTAPAARVTHHLCCQPKQASLTPEDEALLLGRAPKPRETFQEHVNRNWQDIPEDKPESCPTCGDEGEYTGYHNGHHHFECDRCGEGFSKKAARKPRPLQGPEHPFTPHPDDPEQCVECNLPESNRHHQDVEFQHRLPQPLAHVEPGWEDEQGSMDRYKPRTWHEDLHEAFDMQRVHEDLQEDEHWGGGRGEEAHARENGYQRSNLADFRRHYREHGRTARRYDGWRPHDRLFGPTKGDQDPRLFHEHRMLPKVREHLLAKMDGFMAKHGGPNWRSWARMYLAGSEASDWWGNNDFDVLVGVDYDGFRKATGSTLENEEITDAFNRSFRADWNDESWHPPFDDQVWHLTGYVNPNSYDIRKIKPYAAYDVGADTWAVKPVQVSQDWGPDKFPVSTWRVAEHYADEIQRIASLEPASIRQQYAERLFEHIHTDRSRAFSPRGTGVFDVGNVAEKYLDQRPDHPLALLVEMKNQGKSSAENTEGPEDAKAGSAAPEGAQGGGAPRVAGRGGAPSQSGGLPQAARAVGADDIAEHGQVKKDLKGLHPTLVKKYAQMVDHLADGNSHPSTHPLNAGLKGWSATALDAKTRIVHRLDVPSRTFHVAYVGPHDYEKAERRVASAGGWDTSKDQYRAEGTYPSWLPTPPKVVPHGRIGCYRCRDTGKNLGPNHTLDTKNVKGADCKDCHGVGHLPSALGDWEPQHDGPDQQASRAQYHQDGDGSAHRRRLLDLAKNPKPGLTVTRGETRTGDPTNPESVGMHWTANNNVVLGHAREGEHHVVYHATHDDQAEHFPRSHPIWSGKHMSLDSEAEVRYKPGTSVHVHGAFVWHGDGPAKGLPVPDHPERTHKGWKYHPINRRIPVGYKGQGETDYGDFGIHRTSGVRKVATDWHQFDTNYDYRQGHVDGARGDHEEHARISEKLDGGKDIEDHEINYLVGHAAGQERAREHARAAHDMKRIWEQHGTAYGAKKAEGFEPPTVSGVALQAADTGRLLMIQRSNSDEKDPARGTWEFPGGHHEDGDTSSLHAGIREWEEEVGHPFPEGGTVTHTWRTGPYQGHHVVIPEESAVDFSQGRRTVNPDDPDCDDHEQSAWWDPEHAKKNPALRQEVKDNWSQIVPGLKQVKASLSSLPEGYSYRHIVHQPRFGNARYGDQVPHPSQEDVYNEGPAKAFGGAHLFEHQVVHRGTPVAKLRYSVHPDEPHVLNIEGLAVHQDHQGKGLAIHLGDHMQSHAEKHGMKIDHGTYTDQGHYFATKYMASPNAKPHLHLPYPDKPTATTGDVFIHHMLDPEEMKAGQHGRTASLNEPQAIGGWVHYHGDPGWHEDHDDALAHKDATGTYHPSLGRVLHGRLKKHHTASLDGVPLPEHEQEARLAPGIFKEQSKPQAAPSDHVVAGARSYCAQRNMPDPHATDYSQVKTTAENTRTIGRAYDSLPNYDHEAVPHYEALRQEVHHQFKHMTEHMGMKVHFVDEDPYSTSKEMMHDVHHNKTIKVLKTERTGGHPYFSNEDNDKFRAVHDVFGHAATGRGFDKHGEEAAYTAHSKMFSAHAQPALETETRGQNHFYNLNGRFAKQKVAIVGKALGTYRRAVDHGRTAMRRIASRVYL